MSSFGKVLRQLRIQDGLTQTELGNALGVSFSTISMYERGEREPDFEMLEVIADYFNVSMDYLHNKEKSSPQREERTPGRERHQKYEEIFDLFEGLSESRTELALKGMLYLMNIPDEKLPEAVRYLQFLSENAES